jgi:hypothetical protein
MRGCAFGEDFHGMEDGLLQIGVELFLAGGAGGDDSKLGAEWVMQVVTGSRLLL